MAEKLRPLFFNICQTVSDQALNSFPLMVVLAAQDLPQGLGQIHL